MPYRMHFYCKILNPTAIRLENTRPGLGQSKLFPVLVKTVHLPATLALRWIYQIQVIYKTVQNALLVLVGRVLLCK